jgi:hypothetical protein
MASPFSLVTLPEMFRKKNSFVSAASLASNVMLQAVNAKNKQPPIKDSLPNLGGLIVILIHTIVLK